MGSDLLEHRTPQDQYRDAKRRNHLYLAGIVARPLLAVLALTVAAWVWILPAAAIAAALIVLEAAWEIIRRTKGRDARTLGSILADYVTATQWAYRWSSAVIRGGAANIPTGRSFEEWKPGGARIISRTVQTTPAGVRFQVKGDLEQLEQQRGKVAEKLNRAVAVNTNPLRPAEATVTIREQNPLADVAELRWPWLDKPELTAWDPIPLGVSEDGEPVTYHLPTGSLLVGGLRGGGKSALIQMIAATAVLAPDARLWLLDGKAMELLPFWGDLADGAAGRDPNDAIRILEQLVREMEARADMLASMDPPARKLAREHGLPVDVLICDEIGYYTRNRDKEIRDRFTDLMWELVSLGRAPGVNPNIATQKPSDRIISADLRDQFQHAVAFACSTPQQSDTILGQGSAAAGWNAQDLSTPGVALIRTDDGIPKPARMYYLTDEHLGEIRARALAAGGIEGLERMLAEAPAPPKPSQPPPPPPVMPPKAPAAKERVVVREAETNVTQAEKVMDLLRRNPDGLSRAALDREGQLGDAAMRLLAEGRVVRELKGPKSRFRLPPDPGSGG